jgi:hypothetical protein
MTWWSGSNSRRREISVKPLRKPSKLAKILTPQRLKYRYFLFAIKKINFGIETLLYFRARDICWSSYNILPTEIRPYNCYIVCRRERALQSELSLHDSDLGWSVWIATSRITTRIVWTNSLKPKPVNREIIRSIGFIFGYRYQHGLYCAGWSVCIPVFDV